MLLCMQVPLFDEHCCCSSNVYGIGLDFGTLESDVAGHAGRHLDSLEAGGFMFSLSRLEAYMYTPSQGILHFCMILCSIKLSMSWQSHVVIISSWLGSGRVDLQGH